MISVYVNKKDGMCIYKLPWGTSIQNYSKEYVEEFVKKYCCKIYLNFNEFINDTGIDSSIHLFASDQD